jgi:hypothetical protein
MDANQDGVLQLKELQESLKAANLVVSSVHLKGMKGSCRSALLC